MTADGSRRQPISPGHLWVLDRGRAVVPGTPLGRSSSQILRVGCCARWEARRQWPTWARRSTKWRHAANLFASDKRLLGSPKYAIMIRRLSRRPTWRRRRVPSCASFTCSSGYCGQRSPRVATATNAPRVNAAPSSGGAAGNPITARMGEFTLVAGSVLRDPARLQWGLMQRRRSRRGSPKGPVTG